MVVISLEDVQKKLEERYNKMKKDYTFTMATIAKKFGVQSPKVRGAILTLEERGLVERTTYSCSRITWRTKFGQKN